jgi:aconitate hydratase
LIVLAGTEYGTGSSRDWAAKGSRELGVRAVMAKSFERIHRSNLIGMGVLPVEFMPGEDMNTLGLQGDEVFSIRGLQDGIQPEMKVNVTAERADGQKQEFSAKVRIDTAIEVEYYRNGGILHMVLRQLIAEE